jgi:hypothetical protein
VGAFFVGAGASGASFAEGELAGAEVSGVVLEGEAVAFFFFLGEGGTGSSARSASSFPAPMLLAPVSSVSGGERNPPPRGDMKVQGPRAPHLWCPPKGRRKIFRYRMVPDLLEEWRSWRHPQRFPVGCRECSG